MYVKLRVLYILIHIHITLPHCFKRLCTMLTNQDAPRLSVHVLRRNFSSDFNKSAMNAKRSNRQ